MPAGFQNIHQQKVITDCTEQSVSTVNSLEHTKMIPRLKCYWHYSV